MYNVKLIFQRNSESCSLKFLNLWILDRRKEHPFAHCQDPTQIWHKAAGFISLTCLAGSPGLSMAPMVISALAGSSESSMYSRSSRRALPASPGPKQTRPTLRHSNPSLWHFGTNTNCTRMVQNKVMWQTQELAQIKRSFYRVSEELRKRRVWTSCNCKLQLLLVYQVPGSFSSPWHTPLFTLYFILLMCVCLDLFTAQEWGAVCILSLNTDPVPRN